jgi:hypothetical protein
MKKQKIVTLEERDENMRRELLRNINLFPEPSYLFSIGDSVSVGNLLDAKVIDVLENGKIYKIDYTNCDHNYGKPLYHPHATGYWEWMSVRPPIEVIDHSIIKNIDLQLNYSQRPMADIFSKKYHFGLVMNPPYQRDYVWDMEDKIKLINSIFNNIDIGKFVFISLDYYDREDHYSYEILDGKQRIDAVTSFYENRFSYNGLYFNQMNKHEQHHFTEYPIAEAEVRNLTEEQKLRYFLMVNTTGKSMGKEQLDKVRKMIEEEENK